MSGPRFDCVKAVLSMVY